MRRNGYSVTAGRFVRRARVTKEIMAAAESAGVRIVRARPGDHSNVGIHLLEAEQFELEDALERAARDSFPAIYLHTFKTWRAEKPVKRRPFKLTLLQGGKGVQL